MIALIIFFAVEGALAYAMIRFRKRKGAVPAQIRGNTRLEVGWTAGAALILVGLAVFTFVKLSAIENPPNSGPGGASIAENPEGGLEYASATRKLPPNGKSLAVKVIGRQYIWQYVYPGVTNRTGRGRRTPTRKWSCPRNTVTLDIVSRGRRALVVDPRTRRQVPGGPRIPQLHLVQDRKPGTYQGQCAFLCGRGHARMIATVRAVPPAKFEDGSPTRSGSSEGQRDRGCRARKGRQREKPAAVEATGSEWSPNPSARPLAGDTPGDGHLCSPRPPRSRARGGDARTGWTSG